MTIHLQRPAHVRVRLAGRRTRRRQGWIALALAALGRGLLVGIALGVFLVTGSGVASVTLVGVIALGAALMSWDP
jgi:hypothetical protein